jgi:pimeloyl-ACP methyl ester carboxylesterase
MDTGAGASPDNPSAAFMRAGLELARTGGMDAVLESIERFIPDDEDGRRTRDHLRHNYPAMDAAAFTALGEELLTHASILDQLAALVVPTTVIVGEHDKGLRSASDDLAATIPGAVLEVIAHAAHSPQVEAREAWLEAVGRHLDRVD